MTKQERVWQGKSELGSIDVINEVINNSGFHHLLVNGELQSKVNLSHPADLSLRHYHYLLAEMLFVPPPQKVLLLGLGGGDLLRFFDCHFPLCSVTAMELDPVIVKVAKEFFHLPAESVRFSLAVGNALTFYEQISTSQDLIFLDVFQDAHLPAEFSEMAFFLQCKQALSEKGCLAINLIPKDAADFTGTLARLRVVFDKFTLCLTVPQHQNIIILAFNERPADLSRAALEKKATQLLGLGVDFSAVIDDLFVTNPTINDELII